MTRLLDQALPDPDVREVHDAWIDAPPERVHAAIRRVGVTEIRLLAPLMTLRLLPEVVLRRRLPTHRSGPVLDAMLANGFTLLGERAPGELALAAVGRFWRPDAAGTFRDVEDVDDFRAFTAPGYAKAAMDFRVTPERSGARVTTETRVAGTDAAATRRFGLYWRLVGPGSGLIRISWLNAIRRRAGS